jgi:Leucine-rich repeat (LRR) protein
VKNTIIGLLVVAVLGLGGWVAYDKSKTQDSTTTSTTGSTAQTTAPPKSANTLDLSSQGLTKVGPDIYNKTGTTALILSNNNLQTLPSEMGKMTKLEILKLDHNRLDGSLIGEVRKMPLKTLDVSYNNMTGVPAEIGQLNKLETLDYSYNKLTGLPNELANLKNNLKVFNLTGNPISQETLAKLKASLPNTQILF